MDPVEERLESGEAGHLACAAITELELPDDGLNTLIAGSFWQIRKA